MTDEDAVVVGRVARAHGDRGHVIVNPETDFPGERYSVGTVLLVGSGGRCRRITAARFHQGRPVIGLEGIESMSDAERLAGAELRLPAAGSASCRPGRFAITS